MATKTAVSLSAILLVYLPIILADPSSTEPVAQQAMPQADLILPLPGSTLAEPRLTQKIEPAPMPAPMPEPNMTIPPKSTTIPQPTVTVAPEPPTIDKSATNIAPLERFLPPSPPASSGMSKIQDKNKLKPGPKPVSPSYIEPALIPPKIEIPTSPPPDSIFKRDKHGDDDWGPQPSCTRSPCN
jgi:hypothetical protein